jgi:hypothetical protein
VILYGAAPCRRGDGIVGVYGYCSVRCLKEHCRSCVAMLIQVFPVAVEGIRLPRTPGDPSVLCLREEREYGSQLFTIPEP